MVVVVDVGVDVVVEVVVLSGGVDVVVRVVVVVVVVDVDVDVGIKVVVVDVARDVVAVVDDFDEHEQEVMNIVKAVNNPTVRQ